MSDKRKLETEIEWREPIDLHAISQLIGATSDFRAGARRISTTSRGWRSNCLYPATICPKAS
jgi:hypothetical protein